MGAAVGTDKEEMSSGLMAFHLEREERKVQVAGWLLKVRDYAKEKAASTASQREVPSSAQQMAERL